MIEMIIVMPFLFSLIMGIFEFGEGWEANLRVQSATRGAGRTGSSLAANRQADYFMLQTLKAGLTKFATADVHRVVIYNANADTLGEPTAGCKSGTPSSGVCNVYTGAQVNALTAADFPGTTCSSTALDRFWCPTTRTVTQASADYLGVWIEVFYNYRTNFFPGNGITMHQYVVMRLEPKAGT
jgi:Flp pilus assembly protein TadG